MHSPGAGADSSQAMRGLALFIPTQRVGIQPSSQAHSELSLQKSALYASFIDAGTLVTIDAPEVGCEVLATGITGAVVGDELATSSGLVHAIHHKQSKSNDRC